MSVAVVIPARYESSRFPGKPLAPLRGVTGEAKPLVRRAWEAARAAEGVDRVVVATDDERIAQAARGFGAEVAMTPASCANGTERCHAALPSLPGTEIVVNLQGDAPLTPAWFVTALVEAVRAGAEVATPVLRCDAKTLGMFIEDRRAGRVGGTTAVFDRQGRALYFSKEVLPHTPQVPENEPIPVFHHVGLYAYTPAALARYAGWPPGGLERCEGLEQLRFLENGTPVACVEVEAPDRVFWELNNPEDTPRVEAALAALGVE